MRETRCIRIVVEFPIDSDSMSFGSDGGVFVTDDWAVKEARAFIAGQKDRDLKTEKDLSDRKLKQAWMEKKWDQLIGLVQQQVFELNKQIKKEILVFELTATNSISVGRQDNRTALQVKIDIETFELSHSIGGRDVRTYKLEIKQGDEVDYKRGETFYSMDEIAKTALSSLLRNN